MKRAVALLICVLLLAVSGCNGAEDGGTAVVSRTPAPTGTPSVPHVIIEWRKPVSVLSRARDFGGGYIVYPSIGEGAQNTVNSGIYTSVQTYVEALGRPLYADYTVMTNDEGLFSAVMYLLDDQTYELVDYIALNYDVETGNICTLGSHFDPDKGGWRYLIPDYIIAEAEAMGITLLSDPVPPSDTRSYYVEDGCIVLLYHIYELATYEAGTPAFHIPISDLEEYLAENSILRRFIQ